MSSTNLEGASLFDVLRLACADDINVPQSLINVAAMPIMRCADPKWQEYTGHAPQRHFDTVNGNMHDVLLARKLLLQQVEHGELFVHVDELIQYYPDDAKSWTCNPRAFEYGRDLLESNRIVASPLPAYWNNIEVFYNELFGDELSNLPPFRCPTCAGPI